ncbi:MAG: AbgT family transporter [Spirochaetes bacterium]|nr:AbgT family transporter [Spirochaetota bacterium]
MEEVVVLVPLIVALSVRMGWDTETGLGLSLGAIAFGFAAAISNPFTVGIAQKIAGLPIFSGAIYRILIFILIYSLYTLYVVRFSKRSETGMLKQEVLKNRDGAAIQSDNRNSLPTWSSEGKMRASLLWFLGCMIVMILLIIISSFISALSSLILVVVMLCFLTGGIGAGYISGMRTGLLGKSFILGIGGVAPGIILVLMAASIKHILSSAEVMDSILYWSAGRISQTGPYSAALIIYGLVLVMNFFISSGSAKAFLIVPIIAPLADIVGLSRQSAVLAYIFGDGFSNILYPTNALLLICLSITGVSYGRWFKWIWKIEAIILILTVLILMLAVKIGY